MSGFEIQERRPMRERAQQSDDSGLPPVNALTLNSPAALATNRVVIGHCDKADVVWTGTEFRTLCEHMLNGNSQTDFHARFIVTKKIGPSSRRRTITRRAEQYYKTFYAPEPHRA